MFCKNLNNIYIGGGYEIYITRIKINLILITYLENETRDTDLVWNGQGLDPRLHLIFKVLIRDCPHSFLFLTFSPFFPIFERPPLLSISNSHTSS